MPRSVLNVVIGHLELEGQIGGYEAAYVANDSLDALYRSLATLIGARTDEIAVVENATRGWDMAFYAVPFAPGDRILTSVSEYGSNAIAFLHVAARGVSVEVVPNDESGQLSVTALANMLDERVKVVAISHMPTNGGLLQPAAEIGKLVKQTDAMYLLDACQTAGQLPIDVDMIGCDVLSVTSRKYLRGPRGVGYLYVRRPWIERLVPPFLDIHAATWTAGDRYEIRADARRFENWESNIAGKLGLATAVDYAMSLGLDAIWDRVETQAARLREELENVPGIQVHDIGAVKGGIVTFSVAGRSANEIQCLLRHSAINVSTSGISSTRYDMEQRGLTELIRASVHYLTTDEEIALLTDQVEALARTAK